MIGYHGTDEANHLHEREKDMIKLRHGTCERVQTEDREFAYNEVMEAARQGKTIHIETGDSVEDNEFYAHLFKHANSGIGHMYVVSDDGELNEAEQEPHDGKRELIYFNGYP